MVAFNQSNSQGSNIGTGVTAYKNGGWIIEPGAGISGSIFASSIAIDGQGKPVVAFFDSRDPDRRRALSILRFNNGWEPVGPLRFTSPSVQLKDPQIKISSNGDLIVSFLDLNSDKVSVMMYSTGKNAWEYVGLPNINNKVVLYHQLALGSTGSIFLAVDGVGPANFLSVWKYSGSTWENVGSPDIANFRSDFSLVVDGGNTPFLGYSDFDSGVFKIIGAHGGVWSSLRNPGVVPGLTTGASTENLAVSSEGIIFAGISDGELGGGLTILKTGYEP